MINLGYKRENNRWFISYGFGKTAKPDLTTGFKSTFEFETWLKKQCKTRGSSWRAGFVWKFADSDDEYRLCDKDGNLLVVKD